jgi:predicted DNA-binding protein
MSRKKVSTTIYITPEQEAALHEPSARTKVPMAEYIREGLDRVIRDAIERGLLPSDEEVAA